MPDQADAEILQILVVRLGITLASIVRAETPARIARARVSAANPRRSIGPLSIHRIIAATRRSARTISPTPKVRGRRVGCAG